MKKLFVSAVLAGFAISVGATAFLLTENRIVGAVLFCVGLLMVRTFSLALFTGKVSRALDGETWARLGVIWLGNLTGTVLTALVETATRLAPALSQRAQEVCEVKCGDSLLSLFVLGMFCNVMIYLAVTPTEGHLALLYGVVIFVLCGFEHCVADMYYFTAAGVLAQPDTWLRLAVVSAGNAAGGILFHTARKWATG
jgi:formate/nitrite transporter FocA (FNT family)